MRLLLDTHILIWSLTNSPMLNSYFRELISDEKNELYFSPVSIWEISIKHRKSPKKMPISGEALFKGCVDAGFIQLPFLSSHALETSRLKEKEGMTVHEDPFDRALIAQAKTEKLKLITHDTAMSFYNEGCIIKD